MSVLLGFDLAFGLMPPFYALNPPFWNGNIYLVPSLYVGNAQFEFYRDLQVRLP
jgi:hypothetical protein